MNGNFQSTPSNRLDSLVPNASSLDRTPSEENVDEHWNGLMQFYARNEEIIEKCTRLDVREIAKGERTSEIDFQIDSFMETANVILDGLVALGNVHPIIGGKEL